MKLISKLNIHTNPETDDGMMAPGIFVIYSPLQEKFPRKNLPAKIFIESNGAATMRLEKLG